MKRAGRRIAVGVGIGLTVVVFLVALVAGLALTTDWAARQVVNRAVEIYDDSVPGSVRVGSVRGRLGGALEICDIVLRDKAGQERLAVHKFTVQWRPWQLVFEPLEAAVAIDGVRVYLGDDPGAAFTDFAPPTSEEKDEEPLSIPNVPLDARVALRIEDVRVFDTPPLGQRRRLLILEKMTALAAANGEKGGAVFKLAAWSPLAEVRLDSWEAVLTWTPTLKLTASFDAHRVFFEDDPLGSGFAACRGDVAARGPDFESLRGDASVECPDAWFERLGPVSAALTAVLESDGVLASARLSSDPAKLGAWAELPFEGKGLEVFADVRVPDIGAVVAAAMPDSEAASTGGRAAASVRCEDVNGLMICRADARVEDLVSGQVRARRVSAKMQAELTNEKKPFSVGLDASEVRLAGRTWHRIKADAQGDTASAAISLRADGEGGDLVRFAADGALAEGGAVRVGLDELLLRLSGVEARLEEPTHVAVSGGDLALDRTRLSVAGGEIELSADVEQDGLVRVDVGARDVNLGRLGRAVKGLDMGGVLGRLKYEQRGTLAKPTMALQARIDDLRFGKAFFAEVSLASSYARDEARVKASLTQRGAPSSTVTAGLPLRLDFASGTTRLLPGRTLHVEARVKELPLSDLAAAFGREDVTGTASLEASINGTWRRPSGYVRVELANAALGDARFGSARVDAAYENGRLEATAQGTEGIAQALEARLSVPVQVNLVAGSFRLKRAERAHLELDLSALDLDAVDGLVADLTEAPTMGLKGIVHVSLLAEGTPQRVEAGLEVRGRNLGFRDQALGLWSIKGGYRDARAWAQVDGRGGPLGRVDGRIDVPVDLKLGKRPTWSPDKPHEAEIDIRRLKLSSLKETAARWGIELPAIAQRVEGDLDISARIDGTAPEPRVNAKILSGPIAVDGRRIGRLGIEAHAERGRVDAHVGVVERTRRLASLDASVPLLLAWRDGAFYYKWDQAGRHALDFEIIGLEDSMVAAFLEEGSGLEWTISAVGSGHGNAKRFSFSGNARGSSVLRDVGQVMLDAAIELEPKRQKIALAASARQQALLSGSLVAGVDLTEVIKGQPVDNEAVLDGNFELAALPLDVFADLLPTALYDPRGKLGGEMKISGTLGRPDLQGRLELRDGEISVAELNQRLEDISFSAILEGPRIRVDDLRFQSGDGSGRANISVEFTKDGVVSGGMGLGLAQFPFLRPGVPEGFIDSKIETTFRMEPERIRVDVAIRDTAVQISGRSTKAPKTIPSSKAVRFVSELKEEREEDEAASREQLLVLTVSVPEPAVIRGQGNLMSWKGRVQVTAGPNTQKVEGEVKTQFGRWRLLGNDFEIEIGEITIVPGEDIDPYIHLVANTQTPEAQVTATIQGRLSRPDISFSSDPPMPQYQVLALLVTGRSGAGEEEGGDTKTVETQAASLLLAFNNAALEETLRSRLGIDRAALSVGENVDEPILEVGKWIGRKFYVETRYHHNAPEEENEKSLRVEYHFLPRWSLETFYGDASKGGIDVFWRNRFGKRPNENEEKED